MMTELTADDGHTFAAYEVAPPGTPRGGLVVIQEVFGVNPHIRSVADGYANDGYRVIAPAIFDRAERDVELEASPAAYEKVRELRAKITIDDTLRDIAAAVAALKNAGKVGVVGYCFGGSMAWLAAARVPGLSAAIGYYGSMIAGHLDEKPRCPVMLHFGEEDQSIPTADAEKIKAAVDPSQVQVFTYPGAGHAFNRDGSSAWHGPSAKLARERTVEFLRAHVG